MDSQRSSEVLSARAEMAKIDDQDVGFPFRASPRPSDEGGDGSLLVGDSVSLTQGRGTIRFIGTTSFSPGEWVGVELDESVGKNDGSVRGVKYFDCPARHGMFVRRSAMIRAKEEDGTSTLDSTARATRHSNRSCLSVPSATDEPQSATRTSVRSPRKNTDEFQQSATKASRRKAGSTAELAAAQQELAEAAEDHDVDRLRRVIPVAVKSGVPHAEVEAARHILDFEACRVDTDDIQDSVNRSNQAVVEELRSDLQKAAEEIRRHVSELMREMRQDFASLRGELRNNVTIIGRSSDEGERASASSRFAAPRSEAVPSQLLVEKEKEEGEATGHFSQAKAHSITRRLVAVVKGGAERREQRRREAAVSTIQRCVKRLRGRWRVNEAQRKWCSFEAVAQAARARNKEWASVFDRGRKDQEGLTEESFLPAMTQLCPRLSHPQCHSLFQGFIKGMNKSVLDFRGFCNMLEAVATSDHAAAEYADLTEEEWIKLHEQPVKLSRFAKHRSATRRDTLFREHAFSDQSVDFRQSVEEMQGACAKLDFDPQFTVYSMDLHEEGVRRNIQLYYRLCAEQTGLAVTTSCFTVWRKHNKTNGHAKLIPAVPDTDEDDSSSNVRIFFFDDNLDMAGAEESTGICNLRDVRTGEFVDFNVGRNGFRCEHAARHTIVHHSDRYRNVLVKANILDAIEDKEYFSSIIERWSKPDEKIIIFMDVNSTIVCNDAVQGKDLRGTLLSTMFEFMELRPRSACDFVWDGSQTIRLDKPMLLRSLVKELTKASAQTYSAFWREANCHRFIDELSPLVDLRWCLHDGTLTRELFYELYEEYVVAIEKDVSKEGITSSWFECFKQMETKHTVVLNSFGVDTRKVVLATGLDETKVLQIAVNHEMWDDRDKQKYELQFTQAGQAA